MVDIYLTIVSFVATIDYKLFFYVLHFCHQYQEKKKEKNKKKTCVFSEVLLVNCRPLCGACCSELALSIGKLKEFIDF